MEQGQGSNGAPWILIHYLLVEIDGLRKLFVRFFRIVSRSIEIVQRRFLIEFTCFQRGLVVIPNDPGNHRRGNEQDSQSDQNRPPLNTGMDMFDWPLHNHTSPISTSSNEICFSLAPLTLTTCGPPAGMAGSTAVHSPLAAATAVAL